MEEILFEITGYNQKGEGIAIHNAKVFYIPGTIKGEKVFGNIIFEKKKYGRVLLKTILTFSPNRNFNVPKNYLEIGGYELLHMNKEEQMNFKTNKVIEDFKNNAQSKIKLEKIYAGEKHLHYRNKVTLHNGGFHKLGTNTTIRIPNFLLANFETKTKLKGEIIIRVLDTRIEGKRKDKKYTTDTMHGVKFRVGIGSFYQTNKEVATYVYKDIVSNIKSGDIVLDLYSGIGTITLLAAKKAQAVIGIERNKSSYLDALYNKKINNISNVSFVLADVIKFVNNYDKPLDVIIVDPPREGLTRKLILSLLKLAPKKIIYLSCNPGTQSADFALLKSKYKITYARIYDMFPQTYHIENLIILELI